MKQDDMEKRRKEKMFWNISGGQPSGYLSGERKKKKAVIMWQQRRNKANIQ